MRFFISIIPLLFLTVSVYSQNITIGTEDFPPYSYIEKGQIKGLSTEVVQAVLKNIGVKAEIEIYPWARAFAMGRDEANHLLFSVSRTKERETLFKWIGTISPYNIYLFKLKSRKDIVISTLNDAKKYSTGSVPHDIKIEYLENKGFTNIHYVSKDDYNIEKLVEGRVDIIPYDELGFTYKIKQLGHDPNLFEKVFFLHDISKELYMAFGSKTDDNVVNMFKRGLETIKKNGTYERIRKKYLN